MKNKQPILSICIPIYNRIKFLRRHFEQYLKCKDCFLEDIQLYISDNCSEENLLNLVNEFRGKGLNLEYSRNPKNLGPDGNFIKCFNNAKGKYIWLLGSDDVPVDGFVPKLLGILKKHDYGYLFLNHKSNNEQLVEYMNVNDILENVNVWITFMSANIVRTEYVKKVDGNKYLGTFLIQVPYFLEGMMAGNTNAILNSAWIQAGSDAKNNGGYNLFQVFAENLFSIISSVCKGKISSQAFQRIKKSVFFESILNPAIRLLVIKDEDYCRRFSTENGWHILMKHYGFKPYFYYYMIRQTLAYIYGKYIKKRYSD